MFYSSTTDIVKEFKTLTATFRLINNGIIHIAYYENVEIGRNEQIANNKALVELVGNVKHLILLEGGEFSNFSKEGLDTVTELELSAPILARAIVTKSIAQKLYVIFFKRLTSVIPIKTFENYTDAVEWLLSLKTIE